LLFYGPLLSFETCSFGGLSFGSQSRLFGGLLFCGKTSRFGIRVYQHFAIFLRLGLRLYQLGTRAHCCSCQLPVGVAFFFVAISMLL